LEYLKNSSSYVHDIIWKLATKACYPVEVKTLSQSFIKVHSFHVWVSTQDVLSYICLQAGYRHGAEEDEKEQLLDVQLIAKLY